MSKTNATIHPPSVRLILRNNKPPVKSTSNAFEPPVVQVGDRRASFPYENPHLAERLSPQEGGNNRVIQPHCLERILQFCGDESDRKREPVEGQRTATSPCSR